jgi:excisionase family DNA binding protein
MSMSSQKLSTAENVTETEPLVVKPGRACFLLNCGNTRCYELIATGELESYLDGRSRKITVASIRSYIARRLAESSGTGGSAPRTDRSPRRGRPRKINSGQL